MTKKEEPELWDVPRIAAYLGIGHESVRKALWRKGISEMRGYSAAKIKAEWPQSRKTRNRKALPCD